jgi:hypothetical protein
MAKALWCVFEKKYCRSRFIIPTTYYLKIEYLSLGQFFICTGYFFCPGTNEGICTGWEGRAPDASREAIYVLGGASPGTNVAHLYRGVSPAVTNVAMAHLYRMEIHPGINVSIFFIGV